MVVMASSTVSSQSRENVLGDLRIGRILTTAIGDNLDQMYSSTDGTDDAGGDLAGHYVALIALAVAAETRRWSKSVGSISP